MIERHDPSAEPLRLTAVEERLIREAEDAKRSGERYTFEQVLEYAQKRTLMAGE